MKLLCAQVLKDLLGEGIDVRVINTRVILYYSLQLRQLNCMISFFQFDKVTKLTADAKFGKLFLYWLEKLELLGTLKTRCCHLNLEHQIQSLPLRGAQAKKIKKLTISVICKTMKPMSKLKHTTL